MKEEFLRIFCSNVRGLVCNWDAVKSVNWSNYDVVAFNEVWSIKEFENLRVNEFEIKTKKLRDNRRGGGTVIFGRQNLECSILQTPFIEGCIETTGIKIGDIYFINVYRPPNGNIEQFTNSLSPYLYTLRGSKIIIGGDYNINYLVNRNWFDEFGREFGLTPKISNITRISSSTCIDNYLTNIDGYYEVSDICIADHQAIVAKIEIIRNKSKPKQKFSYRQMKENNFALFNHRLYNSIELNGSNINEKWENLQHKIHDIVEECFPIKQSSRKYLFTMSQGLLKSRDKKNKLLRLYKRGRIEKEIYTEYNKIYRKLIKSEQTKEFNIKLKDAGTNGREKWKVIKTKLLLESSKQSIDTILVDGKLLTTKEEIADAFKTHFETCALKLAENLPQGEDTSAIMPTGPNWSFKQVSYIDILKIIRSMKNKNSAGYDCLSNRMLKKEAYRFSTLLTPLINESLNEGIFPSSLKRANLIPIYKKGDRSNLNNYRPIALLPVLSKVFEKVINIQLTEVIEPNFIDENQFGFWQGFSTEDAALKFVNQIQKDLGLKKTCSNGIC